MDLNMPVMDGFESCQRIHEYLNNNKGDKGQLSKPANRNSPISTMEVPGFNKGSIIYALSGEES
jgi:CheY-like chemotaxis protein